MNNKYYCHYCISC